MATVDIKKQLAAIRGLSLPDAGERKRLSIRDVKAGGYLEMEGETYQVTAVYRYLEVKWETFARRKSDYWVTELQLLNLLSGEPLFIEWEFDDELELSLTLSEVKLKDIRCNGRPVTRAALESIAYEEEGEVQCRGEKFYYSEDDSWAALFYREVGSEPLPVRLYEFEADNDQYLTVELWEEDGGRPEREAFISRALSPDAVEVLQAQAGDTQQ